MCPNLELKPRSCPASTHNQGEARKEHGRWRWEMGGGGKQIPSSHTRARAHSAPTTFNQLVNQLAGLHSTRGHHEAD